MIGRTLLSLLGIGSQFLNTGVNLALAVLVARSASPALFGWWATVNVSYYLSLQLSRAMVSTPMMVDEHVDRVVPKQIRRQALSGSLAYAVIFMTLTGVVALVLPEEGRVLGLIVALSLPGILVGDAVRHLALRSGEGVAVFGYDSLWVVLQFVGFALLIAAGRDSAMTLTLVWGASASVATFVHLAIGRVRLRLRDAREFHARHRESRGKLVLESMLGLGVLQLLPALLAVTASLSTAGAFRAAQTLYGPVTVLILAMTPMATSWAVQAMRNGISNRLLEWAFTGAVAVSAAAMFVAFTLWPDLGRLLIGASWPGAESILVPMAIFAAFRGHAVVIPVLLRARRAFSQLLQLRLRNTFPLLLFSPVGGAAWGLQGAAWGLVAATLIMAVQNARALGTGSISQGDHGA